MRHLAWLVPALVAGPAAFLAAVAAWRLRLELPPAGSAAVVALVAIGLSGLGGAPTGDPTVDAVERAVVVVAAALLGARLDLRVLAVVLGALGLVGVGSLGTVLVAVGAGLLAASTTTGQLPPTSRGLAAACAAGAALTLPTQLGHLATGAAALGLLALVVLGARTAPADVRRLLVGGALAVVVVVGLAGVASLGAARRALADARTGEQAARSGLDAARRLDRDGAAAQLELASRAFTRVADGLGQPAVRVLELVPVVAQHVELGRDAGFAGAALSRQAGEVLAEDPAAALAPRGGALDLARLRALAPQVAGVTDRVAASRRVLRDDRSPWLVQPASRRLEALDRELAEAQQQLDPLRLAAERLPGVLGADRPRRYLLVFTASAELRGTQGIVGSYAEVEAAGGRIRLVAAGRDGDLNTKGTPPEQRTLEGTPEAWRGAYGRFRPQQTWQNFTMDPHFPSAAQAMAATYPRSGGGPVDGVIAVDPAGVAAVLGITGPVQAPGLAAPVGRDDAPDLLGIGQYRRFQDQAQRQAFLAGLTVSTFQRLTELDGGALRAGAPCAAEAGRRRHLLVWMADPAEQALVERAGFDGALPDVRPGTDQAGAALQNAAGNKLDWFGRHDVEVRRDGGAVEVVVHLRQQAPPPGEPEYVTKSLGSRFDLRAGATSLLVVGYGSGPLVSASVDGSPATPDLQALDDGGRQLAGTYVDLQPGEEKTVRFRFTGVGGEGDPVTALPAPPRPGARPC